MGALPNNRMQLTRPAPLQGRLAPPSQLIRVLGEPSSMEQMTINYRPTQSDLVHAARVWEGQHWKVARYVVAGLLMACGVYILVAGQWWGGAFVLVGLLEAFNLLPAAVVRAIIEFRTNPKFREEYHLSLTPEGMHFRTATIDSTLKWTHYSHFLETSKAFILVYGTRMFTVIPKRALSGDPQLTELRGLLTGAIGDRAKVA